MCLFKDPNYHFLLADAANALTATLDATTMLFQALDGTISLSGDEGLSATAGGDMTVTTTNNIEVI